MPQFFFEGNLENKTEIIFSDKELKHLMVFRVKKGDIIKVFDLYGNQVNSVITETNKNFFKAYIKDRIPKKVKKTYISIYFPFIERNAFEEVLRKSCEVDIDELIPIITDYTQRNFIFDINKKKERFNSIFISGLKQSEKSDLPILKEPLNFNDIFNYENGSFIVLSKYDDKNNQAKSLVEVLKNVGEKINLVVGPEGGFSKRELEIAAKKAYIAAIGENIMRTQTACISASAIIRAVKL